jgi:hypothetical protein
MKTNATFIDMDRVDRLGQAFARRLNEHATDLPHDISERLRAARVQALSLRKREPIKVLTHQTAPQLATAGGMPFSPMEEGLNIWRRLASILPLIALLFGLAGIHVFQNELRTAELASLDTELLTDDLPPSAYTDPGFLVFLKSPAPQVKESD